jgi:hypothetical protein
VPREISKIDDVGPALPGGGKRRYAKSMHGDRRVKPKTASVFFYELLDRTGRKVNACEAIPAVATRARGRAKQRSASVRVYASHFYPAPEPLHGFYMKREQAFLAAFALDGEHPVLTACT